MDDCEKYLVALPYPTVPELKANARYAILLSGAFGGKGSESTAIAQYTAHNFYTADYPEINRAYQCITSVEVTHLHLLGNLIRNLGKPVKFASYETNAYWSGNYPAYAYETRSILRSDLDGEKDAVAHYTRLIRQIPGPEIQAILSRIILDEQKHIEILTGFLNAL